MAVLIERDPALAAISDWARQHYITDFQIHRLLLALQPHMGEWDYSDELEFVRRCGMSCTYERVALAAEREIR